MSEKFQELLEKPSDPFEVLEVAKEVLTYPNIYKNFIENKYYERTWKNSLALDNSISPEILKDLEAHWNSFDLRITRYPKGKYDYCSNHVVSFNIFLSDITDFFGDAEQIKIQGIRKTD